MKWNELNIAEASKRFDEYCQAKLVFEAPDKYKELREDLVKQFDLALSEIGINKEEIGQKNNSYLVDLYFGVSLYELLNQKYGMNAREASTPGIWRYLSVMVIPDLVDRRYGTDHPDRFWKKAKRIWLRVIWWYIHLSWQGDKENTIAALKDNTTDEILQLVDRSGRGGYRIELYRAIMKKYGSIPKEQKTKAKLFRRMMVLNTARVVVIEPGLYIDGEEGYVNSLYDYLV